MPTRTGSIKGKLTWSLLATSSTAVLLVCAAFIFLEIKTSDSSVSTLYGTAAIVAVQSHAALASKNPAFANELFQAASARPSIAAVTLYAEDGSLFLSYLRPDLKGHFAPPAQPPPDGFYAEGEARVLVQPILLNGSRLGSVYVRSDTAERNTRIRQFVLMALIALVASWLVVLFFSSRLELMILEPISQLSRAMRVVSKDKNCSVRAYKCGEGELRELIDGFNGMLGQIQQREAASEKARIELENRMRERTSTLEQEIAERTRLQQQLLQGQKMEALGQLAGGIAHDFNNLLTVIMGNLSLARIQSGPDGKIAALLQAAEQGSHRASDLTRQLLAVGRRTFNVPKALDLHEVVTEVMQILKRTIDPRIVIETTAPEAVWLVHADSGQMFQVLMNLCVNARDAMPDGGVLGLAIKHVVRKAQGREDMGLGGKSGGFVQLIVSDTGSGMEPETCRRIFEPFFTTKEVGKGLGLGLAMVYGMVTQNKGIITVDSKLGAGSRFTIEFPRYRGTEADEAVSVELVTGAEEPNTGPEGSGETILLVEDEDGIRKLARKVLEQLGYVVLEAEDGQLGLTAYQEQQSRISAVILDLTMPKKSGLEVLASIRRMNPGVRVILSSGYSAAAQKLDLAQLGVMAFLQKPYIPNELARTLRTVLDQKL